MAMKRRLFRILGAALGEPEFALGSSPTLAPLPERLRTSRAVMALEHSIAASAEVLLAKLSQGAPESPLTREAKSALGRVQARSKAQK